jgi:hypothetical protein
VINWKICGWNRFVFTAVTISPLFLIVFMPLQRLFRKSKTTVGKSRLVGEQPRNGTPIEANISLGLSSPAGPAHVHYAALVVAVGSAEVEFRCKWVGDFSACLSVRIQDLKILPVNDTKPHGRVKKEHGWR